MSQVKPQSLQLYQDQVDCCFSPGKAILLTVTNACNQYCHHCMRDSARTTASLLDLSTLEPALASAIPMLRPDRVVISGGEPTLVPNLAELITAIHHLDIHLTLCTNATTINSTQAWRLSNIGLRDVTVGLEGFGEGYNWFRGMPGGFERAIQGIRAFISAGIAVTVNITLHNRILNSAESFARTFGQLEISAISVTSPIVQGRLYDYSSLFSRLTIDRVKAFANDLANRVSFPVRMRIPRCNQGACPSGTSIFAMNRLGILSECPDVGAANVVDLAQDSYYGTKVDGLVSFPRDARSFCLDWVDAASMREPGL